MVVYLRNEEGKRIFLKKSMGMSVVRVKSNIIIIVF